MLLVLLPHFQTCLANNQVVKVCRKLLQKVESSSTLSFFSVHDSHLLAQGKLILQQVTPLPCMTSPAHNFIQSKISICATCGNLICCKIGLKMGGKTCNIAFFNSVCNNVSKQAARFSCPFYRSLSGYPTSSSGLFHSV